jgi:hypothetical protein
MFFSMWLIVWQRRVERENQNPRLSTLGVAILFHVCLPKSTTQGAPKHPKFIIDLTCSAKLPKFAVITKLQTGVEMKALNVFMLIVLVKTVAKPLLVLPYMQRWHRPEVLLLKYLGTIQSIWVRGLPSIYTPKVYCRKKCAKEMTGS